VSTLREKSPYGTKRDCFEYGNKVQRETERSVPAQLCSAIDHNTKEIKSFIFGTKEQDRYGIE